MSIASTLAVVSLRGGATFRSDATSVNYSRKARIDRAMLVTICRAPLAIVGVVAVLWGWGVVAITAFIAFALVDLFDGALARQSGVETAARRIADVVIDRAAIQLAVIATTVVNDLPIWIPILMFARDLIQAAYSAHSIRLRRRVVIGPHSHMAYGIAMLVWGSYSIATHSLQPTLTALTLLISAVVLVDYIRRCNRIPAWN